VKRFPPKEPGLYDGEQRRGYATVSKYQWYANSGPGRTGEWRKLNDPPPSVHPDDLFTKAQERQTKGSSQYVDPFKPSGIIPWTSRFQGSTSRARSPSPIITPEARAKATATIAKENADREFAYRPRYTSTEEADRRTELERAYSKRQETGRRNSLTSIAGGRFLPESTDRKDRTPSPDGGMVQKDSVYRLS
jgi:hypothetical protein